MNKRNNLIVFISLLIAGVILDLAPIEVAQGVDKIYHFIGFFVISLSAISTFLAFFDKKWLNFFFIFMLTVGALCAGLSEDAQKLTVIRGCDVFDWITNISGISLACILSYLYKAKIDRESDDGI